MTDLYPRYANDKVDLAVALAPVARLSNMISPLRFLIPMSTHIEVGNKSMPQSAVGGNNKFDQSLAKVSSSSIFWLLYS